MNKMDIFKSVAELVVSVGVSAIVGNAIKLTTEPGIKLPKKIAIGVGGVVLSSMVADMATTYTSKKIDEYAETATKIFTTVKLMDGTETIVLPPEDVEAVKDADATDYEGLIVNGEMVFSTLVAAEKIKSEIVQLLREVEFVTVNDAYFLAGIRDDIDNDANSQRGWDTVKGFRITTSPAGYIIKTPDIVARPTTED